MFVDVSESFREPSLVKRMVVRVVWHCYEPLINVRNRVRGKSLQVARTTSIVLDEEAACASHGKWYLFKLFFFIHGASWNWKRETSLAVTKATGRNTFVEGKSCAPLGNRTIGLPVFRKLECLPSRVQLNWVCILRLLTGYDVIGVWRIAHVYQFRGFLRIYEYSKELELLED